MREMPPELLASKHLRDFGRSGVLDTPANRARRAAFFHSLPGRLMVELEDMPEDVDDAIDTRLLDTASDPFPRYALISALGLLAIGFLAGVTW
jgi:hypothetical protein